MDVTESAARRELDQINRLLKERERDHAREVDEVRDGYRGQIKDLKESQEATLERTRRKTAEQLEQTRRDFDEQIGKTTDSYERVLSEERRAGYDKTGRMASENVRERDAERKLTRAQMEDLTNSSKHSFEVNNKENDERAKDLRERFEKDRVAMKQYLDQKLETQKQMQTKALAEAVDGARDIVDKNTRDINKLAAREKLGADLKYKKLADESQAERAKLTEAFASREKQLADEKNFIQQSRNLQGNREFDEYQKRAGDTLNQVIEDNHFLNAKKDRDHADQITQLEQGHQRKIQDLNSQYRQAENIQRAKADAERQKGELASQLGERRAKQEAFLNNEAMRKNAQLSEENLKSLHSQRQQELEEKHQRDMMDYRGAVQKSVAEQELKAVAERAELQKERSAAINEGTLRAGREKQILVKSYQDAHDALDDLRLRQLEDQKHSLGKEVTDTKADARRDIAQKALENQTRLYLAQETLRRRTDELEATRKQDLSFADSNYQDRVKRLTDNYNRNLVQQQQGFEDTTSSLRHETSVQMAKLQGDAEHEKRMQQLDLQTKNRILMTAFESRLNQVKDEHAAEMTKLKSENDKALRDVLRKTKETLDRDRSLHSRELESKDMQMKERLKLQEEQFKAEIERLKRTNDLALKKS